MASFRLTRIIKKLTAQRLYSPRCHQQPLPQIQTSENAGAYLARSGGHNWVDMAEKEPGFFSVVNEVLGEEEAKATLDAFSETYRAGNVSTLRWRKDMNSND